MHETQQSTEIWYFHTNEIIHRLSPSVSRKLIHRWLRHRSLNPGFTLIELLIAVSLITVITSMSFINIRNYTDRRAVLTTASDFAADVRMAKSRAQTQVKPVSGCTSALSGYQVRLQLDAVTGKYTGYLISAECGVPVQVIQKNFPTSLTVQVVSLNTFTFRTLTGAVDLSGSAVSTTIRFIGTNNQQATVTIDRSGRVIGGE